MQNFASSAEKIQNALIIMEATNTWQKSSTRIVTQGIHPHHGFPVTDDSWFTVRHINTVLGWW